MSRLALLVLCSWTLLPWLTGYASRTTSFPSPVITPNLLVNFCVLNWIRVTSSEVDDHLAASCFLGSVLATCLSNSVNCRAANYWYSGFIRLQSVIDAAIIQVRRGNRVSTHNCGNAVDFLSTLHNFPSDVLVLLHTALVPGCGSPAVHRWKRSVRCGRRWTWRRSWWVSRPLSRCRNSPMPSSPSTWSWPSRLSSPSSSSTWQRRRSTDSRTPWRWWGSMTPPFGENGVAAIAPVTLVTCLCFMCVN